MTSPRARLGQMGERLAAEYLAGQGHRVVAANVRRREGEIDLITVDGDTLVFVGVKLRSSDRFGEAVEALSPAKQRRLVGLAAAFGAERPELPSNQRIDVIAIDLGDASVAPRLSHIENAIEG
jgi:putative endonuclease